MLKQFTEYIKTEKLFEPKEKILLTVSGGIDSMTMLSLFIEAGYCFGIAHCNFQLRGTESEGDQEFIEKFAQKKGLILHTKKFDTKGFAENNKISIQMAARELRYTWFEELAQKNNYTKIATAHNLNDVAETLLINLTRGTGIKGLTGIKAKHGKVIRPLLFAKRSDIELFSKTSGISFREDSSNSDTKYMRNAIRHNIIPELEKLNPSFLNTVTHTTEVLKAAENIYSIHLEELSEKLIDTDTGKTLINIELLIEQKITPPVLFELISPFGFNYEHANGIIDSLNKQAGKIFYSGTHQLIIDRKHLIIYKLTEQTTEVFKIEENDTEITDPVKLSFSKIKASTAFIPCKDSSVGTFDADKLSYPLILRRWKMGDYFYPFGMKGKKKLSDFFTDKKLSLLDKKETWIITSGDDIIWVLGYRTDDRFKITESTKQILQIKLK